MMPLRVSAIAAAVLFAAGCTSIPTGPSNLALPGTGKPFEQFQADDGVCKQYAYDSVGGQTATRAQQESGVASTVAGAAIGALIGGAISGGHGAAVGAGVGGGAGALAGLGAADASGYEAQRRYDQAYTQCMYGKGHRVAVSAPRNYAGRYSYYPYYPYYSSYPVPAGTYYPPPGPPRYSYAPPPPPPGVVYPPPPPAPPNYYAPPRAN
jgi:outer membrane lipoprotein SlyB